MDDIQHFLMDWPSSLMDYLDLSPPELSLIEPPYQ